MSEGCKSRDFDAAAPKENIGAEFSTGSPCEPLFTLILHVSKLVSHSNYGSFVFYDDGRETATPWLFARCSTRSGG